MKTSCWKSCFSLSRYKTFLGMVRFLSYPTEVWGSLMLRKGVPEVFVPWSWGEKLPCPMVVREEKKKKIWTPPVKQVCVYLIDIGPGPGAVRSSCYSLIYLEWKHSCGRLQSYCYQVFMTFQISCFRQKCFWASRMYFITSCYKILTKIWACAQLWTFLFGSIVGNSFGYCGILYVIQ